MISIWFFIGVSLAVNGALIFAAGIYQLVNPPVDPGVVLVQPARWSVVGSSASTSWSDLLHQVRAQAADVRRTITR